MLCVLTLESQPHWSGSVKPISSSLCADESHLQLKIAKCDFPSWASFFIRSSVTCGLPSNRLKCHNKNKKLHVQRMQSTMRWNYAKVFFHSAFLAISFSNFPVFVCVSHLKFKIKFCLVAVVSKIVSLPSDSSSRAYLQRIRSNRWFLQPSQQLWKNKASKRNGWHCLWLAPLLLVGAAVLQNDCSVSLCVRVRACGHAHISLNCFLL